MSVSKKQEFESSLEEARSRRKSKKRDFLIDWYEQTLENLELYIWFEEHVQEVQSWIARDIWAKWQRFVLSEKQLNVLIKSREFVSTRDDRELQKQEELRKRLETLTPFPSYMKSFHFVGTVDSAKWKISRFGEYVSMMLRIDEGTYAGNRVWFRLPQGIVEYLSQNGLSPSDLVEKQYNVKVSSVSPSESDPTFAFSKRARMQSMSGVGS